MEIIVDSILFCCLLICLTLLYHQLALYTEGGRLRASKETIKGGIVISDGGRGVDPNKTTAKKAWASVSLLPLHTNTMAALCVAELRRGRGGSK